jgi:hypothetical protein
MIPLAYPQLLKLRVDAKENQELNKEITAFQNN